MQRSHVSTECAKLPPRARRLFRAENRTVENLRLIMNQHTRLGIWIFACMLLGAAPLEAQEAQWIWAPQHRKDRVPEGSCFFRKAFEVGNLTGGTITIAADDEFELYVNGTKAAEGSDWKQPRTVNITPQLRSGVNLIAVKVTNQANGSAGLLATLELELGGRPTTKIVTDASWRVNLRPLPFWYSTRYNDSRWALAQVLGPAGRTSPWIIEQPKSATPQMEVARSQTTPVTRNISQSTGGEATPLAPEAAGEEADAESRFRILPGFAIQEVLSAEVAGGVLALAFNEFGNIIASIEGGPLTLFYDSNDDGVVDASRVYSNAVKNVQGILPLNGNVYVIGEGSKGTGLYLLSDSNRDGMLEETQTLVEFEGPIGEHGPHSLTLGPDGLIYIVAGNDTKLKAALAEKSPHRHFYEGDLVQRFEDPGGHAVGIKSPGGMVLRTDLEGSSVEVIAGGLRNAYGLAFNRQGDLFVHDSDMEWDEGLPWHRSTGLYQVLPGAEFGWRSGWAKWPEYYPDCLPPLLDTGPGSPTGMVVYDHFRFPSKYQNRLVLTDWANGRILTVAMRRDGASYMTHVEPLLEGQPMNVTGVDIGPDGWIYFGTGGRGTEGGLYRVVWKGEQPPGLDNLGTGITAAIRQPQPHSAWGRQAIAEVQAGLGDDWDKQVLGVVVAKENPAPYRVRALDLMHLYGPTPSHELLLELLDDSAMEVRAKAVQLLAFYPGEETTARLINQLKDPSPLVRRSICESLTTLDAKVPFEKLAAQLESEDLHVAWSARRLLENQPAEDWFHHVLETDSPLLFNTAATAVLIAQPTKERGQKVALRAGQWLDTFLTDAHFLDMLRVIQLAIHRSDLGKEDVGNLVEKLAREFPAADDLMNRELMRTLVYFEEMSLADRYVAHLESDIPNSERLSIAMHLTFLQEGWTTKQKMKILSALESGLEIEGGEGLRGYIENSTKQFVKCFTPEELQIALSMGNQWPNAALACLFELPKDRPAGTIATLRMVDRALAGRDSLDREAVVIDRLRKGIVALLAEEGSAESMNHLRWVYKNEPERRGSVAFGLAQQPGGENFPLIVEAFPLLEPRFATAILTKLVDLDTEKTTRPEDLRQLILLGLRLEGEGTRAASRLLEKWTGQYPFKPSDAPEDRLVSWQGWFASSFPDLPKAEPVNAASSNWDLDELLKYLTDKEFKGGDPRNGALVYQKGQCAACHRHGKLGEAVGPDLTNISKRFQRKQILESILFPSHVISDQYAAKKILTADGKMVVGLVSIDPSGDYLVTQNTGEKVKVRQEDIEEIAPSDRSIMPDGLLDPFTAEEIADLMTFLGVVKEKKADIAEKSNGTVRK